MTCPHLAYEHSDGEVEFDEPRAYCTVINRFVQPMRADICNDRFKLAHDRDCEIFLEADSSEGEGTANR